MSFNRLRSGLRKIPRAAEIGEFQGWTHADFGEATERFGSLADRLGAHEGQQVEARKWLTKQPDVGVQVQEGAPPRIITPETIRGEEFGRRAEQLVGLEGIKRLVKAESKGATKAQRTEKIGQSKFTPVSLSKQIRGELVEEYARNRQLPSKVVSKLKAQARKNVPGTEGYDLARQLMRARTADDLEQVGFAKDNTRFREIYKQQLRDVIHGVDDRRLDDFIRDHIIDNLDSAAEIGLEAAQKTYGRGIRGTTSYEAPSLTTAFLSTGEHVARELFEHPNVPGESVLDAIPKAERQQLFAKLASVFEEPLERMGVIKEEKLRLPPEERFTANQWGVDPIKRVPASAEWFDMLSDLPNVRGGGDGLSFTRPHKWTKARQGADKLVKTFNNDMLKNLNDKTAPVLFKAINEIQEVPYRIDRSIRDDITTLAEQGKLVAQPATEDVIGRSETARGIMNQELEQLRKEYGLYESGGRFPDAPTRKQFEAQKAEILNRYEADANAATAQAGKVSDWQKPLELAHKMDNYGKFYFKVQLDTRGRLYFQNPGLNPQAGPVGRGLLQYDKGTVLDKNAIQNLKTMTASYIETPEQKIAKLSPEERVQYFDDREAEFLRWGQDRVGTYDEWSPLVDDKNRVEFMKAIKEYADWKNDPNHKSHMIAGMDATTSGIQIIAGLLDDDSIAGLVNLIDQKTPGDTYIHVADATKKIIERDAAAGNQIARDVLANEGFWNNRRKGFKRMVMTYPYGAGSEKLGTQMLGDIGSAQWKPTYEQGQYISSVLFNNMEEIIPAMGVFKAIIKKMNSGLFVPSRVDDLGKVKSWIARKPEFKTDVGFPFIQDYPDYRLNREDQFRITHRGRQVAISPRTEQPDVSPTRRSKAETALMANLIHFLDSQLLLKTANKMGNKGYPMTPVHDQFGTTLNGLDDMLKAIQETFKDMFGGKKGTGPRLLEQLIEQNFDVEDFKDLIKRGELDIEETIDAARPFDFG